MISKIRVEKQGRWHIEQGVECQDYSRIEVLSEQGIAVAAIADGVSAAYRSLDGAREAVEFAVGFVCEALASDPSYPEEDVEQLIRNAYEVALDHLDEYAYENDLSMVSLDSTLTLTVYYTESGRLHFGHVGDDGIVAMFQDGRYEMVTKRHSGEIAHSVFPFRASSYWQFGHCDDVTSYVMMTDGLLDWCVPPLPMDNPVCLPKIQDLLYDKEVTPESEDEKQDRWERRIYDPNGYIQRDVSDDITLVAIADSERMKRLPEIDFDGEAWMQEYRSLQERESQSLSDSALRQQMEFNAKSDESPSPSAPPVTAPRIVPNSLDRDIHVASQNAPQGSEDDIEASAPIQATPVMQAVPMISQSQEASIDTSSDTMEWEATQPVEKRPMSMLDAIMLPLRRTLSVFSAGKRDTITATEGDTTQEGQ